MDFSTNYSAFIVTLTYLEGGLSLEEKVSLRSVPRPGDLITCLVSNFVKHFEVRCVEHFAKFNNYTERSEAGGLHIHAALISAQQRQEKLRLI
ncbi:MAG: hypothetical protein F6J92_29495 [Symploca sp. SIO1A3]|nr:hypothetical protein [Symploca sp. SIO2C1]NER50734.1 hypothetical protein [Symploca sp. SIO1A3]